jgi:membrane protein DedA with SNARE-associated domain
MDVQALGLALVVGLLLIKETGVPVPVPGDLLVIGLGVGAAQGRFPPLVAVAAVVAATIVGGSLQFLIVRGPGRRVLVRVLHRIGISEERMESQAERLRRGGAGAVAIARMTPGVRMFAIAAAALAAMPFGRFVLGLSGGNALFAGGHFALGMAFGAAAATIVAGLLVPVAVLVALAVVGLLGWRVIALRRRRGANGSQSGVADWTDASCPACLFLGSSFSNRS